LADLTVVDKAQIVRIYSADLLGCCALHGAVVARKETLNMKQVRLFALAGIVLCCLSTPCLSADMTGRAYVGTALGTFTFISNDYMNGKALDSEAQPRLYGQMEFGYVFKPYLAGTASAGFGWEAYSFDENRLVTIVPANIGAEFRWGTGKYVPRVGAGLGVYHWSVLEDRKVLKDPITRETLRRNDVGIYGLLGLDYFATPSIAVSLGVEGHRIFSKDTEDFPSGYAFNDDLVMLKVGLKYFFSTQRKRM